MLTDYFEPFMLLKSASCPDPYGGQLQQDVTEHPFRAALADALGEEGERGGDSHTRIAEKMARVMRFSGGLVHYGGGLALLQSPQCAIGHEKGGITFLRMTMAFTHYPNQCYSLRKEEFLC